MTGRTPNRDQDRTLSAETAGRLFDRLARPDGLTASASTFARPDVLVALGAGLDGAGRTELEELADRFLAERAVSVVADRMLEERRWSTPELLEVEQRLVASATGRTGEQTAVVSHQAVREALAGHPTAGPDQQAMVRDICQGGRGVGVVVGRAGTGKTFALGIARHAWQLDGYRLLASAPTGIATVSLQGEGFEDVATCDRLLAELDGGREQLDARTVLVVDEAGMVGSRRLTWLLEHAHQAQAKVVLVGDDRQLAAIDAGGGFRALRLHLGASELTENRRQHQAWEREALELVRSGLVEEAVAASQELLAARGRLGPERLRVEDRQLAVGDRVVCGHNAIGELGVANGSRGTITALDSHARTLTLRLDGDDGPEVIMPRSYLEGRGRGEPNRRVDLAYATTGHRAQGLTRGRALVRLTGTEDVNWLYVQLSRARQETRLYAIVGPEPHSAGELDLPDRTSPTATCNWPRPCRELAARPSRSTPPTAPICRGCPRPSCGPSGTGSATNSTSPRRPRPRAGPGHRPAPARRGSSGRPPAAHGHQPGGMLGWLRRDGDQPTGMPGGVAVATQLVNRAHDRERELRQHQQRRDGWLEANAHLGPQYRQVVRTLAWQRRATGPAVEADHPGYVLEALGPVPASTRGRRAWRQAAAEIEQHRRTYQVTDPDRALGSEPREPCQRADRQRARTAIERVHTKQRVDRSRDAEPTRESTIQPQPHQQRGRPGPERAAG